MVGPYAVTELRVSRALRGRGAVLPAEGCHIYLTDTLESPDAEPLQFPLFFKPIAEQHAKALNVKCNVPVIVCLGNPPYDRHEAAAGDNQARTGGWIRWGDDGRGTGAILRAFLDPAVAADTASTSRTCTTSMSTFGAGPMEGLRNRGPHADRVSSASSARQATWMGTRFAECASTCAAFVTRSGFWTLAAKPRHAQERKRLCHSDARGHRRGCARE